jgi:hypothetical protein
LGASCDRASTDAPYIATGSGGAPIGLRDHRRALDPSAAADDARRRHPMVLRPRPTAASAGRHAEPDKRRHAPQRGLRLQAEGLILRRPCRRTRTIARGDQALANRFRRPRSVTVASAPWLSSEPRTHRVRRLLATSVR